MISPGEIYFADVSQGGRRPAIVVSREILNRGRYVVVVACSSANVAKKSTYPNCVLLCAGRFGLTLDTVAQGESVSAIERSALDSSAGPVGLLDEATFRDVIRAIGFVIGSDCEPE